MPDNKNDTDCIVFAARIHKVWIKMNAKAQGSRGPHKYRL